MSGFLKETSISAWVTALRQPFYALPIASATVLLVATTILYSTVFGSRKDTEIQELGGLSILTAWPFFNRRYDFLHSNFAKTGQNLFSFKILHHSIVALKGEAARRAFFDDKGLDFGQGYQLLFGGAPRLKDMNPTTEQVEDVSWLNKQLLPLLRKDRIAELVPTLFDDIQERMQGWGKQGRMDPFVEIYHLVFQMTIRMATCRELATNMDDMTKLHQAYWMLEKSNTPTALLLPWFPSAGRKNRKIATQNLCETLYGYVESRKKAKVPTLDAIDIFLSLGLTTEETIAAALAVIFTGVLNTGISCCWILLYLSFYKEWKQKVIEEVNTMIQTHTNTISSDPLHKRLSAIPVSAWEEGMPVLDLIIRETLRLTMNATFLRRNVLEDITIGNKRLPRGHFLAYQVADAHLNPDIYDNPTQFDPSRYLPGREEHKKQAHAYLGWGSGRHACTGMKLAKLEIKVVIALFVAGYEYDVVNLEGKFPEQLPKPDYNDIHQARPVGDPCYFQFKRIVD